LISREIASLIDVLSLDSTVTRIPKADRASPLHLQ
jgi:hypothetical protein